MGDLSTLETRTDGHPDAELVARSSSTRDVIVDTLTDHQPQALLVDLAMPSGPISLVLCAPENGHLTALKILIQDGNQNDWETAHREKRACRQRLQTAIQEANIDAHLEILTVNALGAVAPGTVNRLSRWLRIEKELVATLVEKELVATLVERIYQNLAARECGNPLFELVIENLLTIDCPAVAAPLSPPPREPLPDAPEPIDPRVLTTACIRPASNFRDENEHIRRVAHTTWQP